MARTKRTSGTVDEHNAETDQVRGDALDSQTNVVDFRTPTEKRMAREEKIRALAGRIDETAAAAAKIADAMKSIRLDAKADNIDWKVLQQLTAMRRKTEVKRIASEQSRREVARAFGWVDGLQIDMLDDDRPEGLIPGQQREFMGEVEISPDKRAAIESGFFTAEELGVQVEA